MVSDKFRRQLRQEMKLWLAEGLIDPAFYDQLAERYQLDSLETAASNRFVAVLLGLGGILLGLGAITFVAANWQAWSREVKTLLLLSLFAGVNIAGFYLWRYSQQSWQHRLGQGLLLLGALILGANLGLMSQMFHLSGPVYELFLVWGLGVIAMAYSLQMTSLGVMAILLLLLGYWQGVGELFMPGEFTWLRSLIEHMPLVASLLFIPLAYWCQSRAIFVLGAIALIPAFSLNLSVLQQINLDPGAITAIACTLPPALLWGYDDLLWPRVSSRLFQPLARTLAIFFFSIFFYWCSFHWFWNFFVGFYSAENRLSTASPLIDIGFLSLLTLWEWTQLIRPRWKPKRFWGLELTTAVIAGFILVSGATLLWHLRVEPIPVVATFIFNVQLFLLAAGLIRIGLALGRRDTFWGGMVLLTLQILSRMLEYNTALLFKSLVFVLCGVGVIAAGLWFERYLTHRAPSQEERI